MTFPRIYMPSSVAGHDVPRPPRFGVEACNTRSRAAALSSNLDRGDAPGCSACASVSGRPGRDNQIVGQTSSLRLFGAAAPMSLGSGSRFAALLARTSHRRSYSGHTIAAAHTTAHGSGAPRTLPDCNCNETDEGGTIMRARRVDRTIAPGRHLLRTRRLARPTGSRSLPRIGRGGPTVGLLAEPRQYGRGAGQAGARCPAGAPGALPARHTRSVGDLSTGRRDQGKQGLSVAAIDG